MKHLPKDIEGVKLPGLQEIIYSFTTAFSVRRVVSWLHVQPCVSLFSHNKWHIDNARGER